MEPKMLEKHPIQEFRLNIILVMKLQENTVKGILSKI